MEFLKKIFIDILKIKQERVRKRIDHRMKNKI